MGNAKDVSSKTRWGLMSMKELEESAFELVQPLAETGMEDGSEDSTHCVGQDSRAPTRKWRCQGVAQKLWLAVSI